LSIVLFNIFNLNHFIHWNQLAYFYELPELLIKPIAQGSQKINIVFMPSYHIPRSLIFYPLIILYRNIPSLSFESLFHHYTSLFAILNIWASYKLISLDYFKKLTHHKILVYSYLIFYPVLCCFMNGRLIYAHLGFSLYFIFLFSSQKPKLFLPLLALWFSSVSSSSFLLLVILSSLSLFFIDKDKRKKLITIIILAIPYLIWGSYKLYLHYKDYPLEILKHGNSYVLYITALLFPLIFFLALRNKEKALSLLKHKENFFLYGSALSISLSFLSKSILWTNIFSYYIVFCIILSTILKRFKV